MLRVKFPTACQAIALNLLHPCNSSVRQHSEIMFTLSRFVVTQVPPEVNYFALYCPTVAGFHSITASMSAIKIIFMSCR
jgi:hypothetical protein